MRAVRIYGKEDVRVEELAAQTAGPGEVTLEGGYSGICGSDLHLYYAPDSMPMDFSKPAELTGQSWPAVLGHEFSGTVTAVGDGVTNVAVGDNVAVFPYHYCGQCASCRAGDPTGCTKIAFEGIQGKSGGMAQVKVVQAAKCYPLPDGVDLKMGALVEPMAVAYHAVKLAKPEGAKSALVVGGGPIGIGAYFALKTFGVETIIVSEPSSDRRDALANIGVANLIDPTTQDVPAVVSEITGGNGVDIVIDCAGSTHAFNGALEALGNGGRFVVAAIYETTVDFNPSSLGGNKTITFSSVYDEDDFQGVIDGMSSGHYSAEGGWIRVIEMDDVVAAMNDLREGKGMKILVSAS